MALNAASEIAGDGFDVRSLACTFRDGHLTGEHTHPWAQLVYARSGIMHVSVQSRVWFVPSTRAIWVPPMEPHTIAVKGEVALRTLYISTRRASGVLRGVETLEVSALLSELIVHILSQGMLDPRRPEHDRLAGVLMDLVKAAPSIDFMLPLPRDERAVRFAEHLRMNPADRRDLEAMAEGIGASLRTLQRIFSLETGLTIESWRQKMRMIHSVMALSGGVSVTEAAMDCGYESSSAYIAAFRKQFGVTPGKFAASM